MMASNSQQSLNLPLSTPTKSSSISTTTDNNDPYISLVASNFQTPSPHESLIPQQSYEQSSNITPTTTTTKEAVFVIGRPPGHHAGSNGYFVKYLINLPSFYFFYFIDINFNIFFVVDVFHQLIIGFDLI